MVRTTTVERSTVYCYLHGYDTECSSLALSPAKCFTVKRLAGGGTTNPCHENLQPIWPSTGYELFFFYAPWHILHTYAYGGESGGG